MVASPIDEYIQASPIEYQPLLHQMRRLIREAAPQAIETMAYKMPTFVLQGNLVHFCLFKHHLGFFPSSSAITHFKSQLSPYKTSVGTIQFPLGQPLPETLIQEIVRFRVTENLTKK